MALRRVVSAIGLVLPLVLVACGTDEPISATTSAGTGGLAPDLSSGGADAGGAADGSGGSAGQPGTGGVDGTGGQAPGLVIDDFEDGDATSLLGAAWHTYNDASNGGDSIVTITDGAAAGEGFESAHSLEITYSFDQGTLSYQPYVGFGTSLLSYGDLSAFGGLSYTYRGAAHTVRIETSDVADYDYHGVVVPASVAWRTVELPFVSFAQEGWGATVPFEPAHAGAVSWHLRGNTGESGSLLLDDVTVVGDVEIERVADMGLFPAAPPADAVLDSVTVDTELQARAMAGLDRGYNITNWLEQGRFTGFGQYDEAFVQRLATAGFRSLRLPIDLDLFVEQRTVDGDTVTLEVSDDLYTVIDAFDQWTASAGLGLTLDYHQYDRSLDFADPATLAEAVELWRLVAAHVADNPREDLFLELLNEPALSVAGTTPTAAQWTALASDMIAAIRETDTTHTVLFGDVDWYNISYLKDRTPFADPNVVYVFHFYEPFVFTHQGASWAQMGATHDIPYPYDPARWSEYSSDFGFTSLNPSWQLSALKGYYQTGNKSWIRNQIVVAKAWAVEHQVPVICNEFGVYDATSQAEDRNRYYADLIDVFAELEIPWQIWFTIMDPATGEVDPGYRTALGLDE